MPVGVDEWVAQSEQRKQRYPSWLQWLNVAEDRLGWWPRLAIVVVLGLIFGRRSVSGSPIGGIAETQEMLDFCGQHNITSDVEVIAIQQVNEAYERLLKSDVKYRFSIDMASLKAE